MSGNPFEIDLDVAGRTMMTRVTGFWNLAAAETYVAQTRLSTERMRARPGAFDMIIDVGNRPPLPREVSDYLESARGDLWPTDVRKTAYVCAGVLGRLQLRRMLPDDRNMGVFATEDEARAWLADGR